MKEVIDGEVAVRHGTVVDRVTVFKGDQGDLLTRALVPFDGKNVRITIEEI